MKALGYPSAAIMKKTLANGNIANTHLTSSDVTLAEKLFGKSNAEIAGKGVAANTPKVSNHEPAESLD